VQVVCSGKDALLIALAVLSRTGTNIEDLKHSFLLERPVFDDWRAACAACPVDVDRCVLNAV